MGKKNKKIKKIHKAEEKVLFTHLFEGVMLFFKIKFINNRAKRETYYVLNVLFCFETILLYAIIYRNIEYYS